MPVFLLLISYWRVWRHRGDCLFELNLSVVSFSRAALWCCADAQGEGRAHQQHEPRAADAGARAGAGAGGQTQTQGGGKRCDAAPCAPRLRLPSLPDTRGGAPLPCFSYEIPSRPHLPTPTHPSTPTPYPPLPTAAQRHPRPLRGSHPGGEGPSERCAEEGAFD